MPRLTRTSRSASSCKLNRAWPRLTRTSRSASSSACLHTSPWAQLPTRVRPLTGQLLQGLGELYAEDYQRKVQGVAAPDKDEQKRVELRAMTRALFAKLDALSHFHYAPFKPAEDVAVRPDVPSLAAEEVAPQVCLYSAKMLAVFSAKDLRGERGCKARCALACS